jgi:hypothetical protein
MQVSVVLCKPALLAVNHTEWLEDGYFPSQTIPTPTSYIGQNIHQVPNTGGKDSSLVFIGMLNL